MRLINEVLDISKIEAGRMEVHAADFDLAEVLKVIAVSASTLEHERQHYLAAGFEDFIGKPVRAEALYRCLSERLGVQFEDASPDTDAADVPPADLQPVALAADLLARLRDAAAVANVTALRRALQELTGLGVPEAALAARLQALVAAFDMEAVLSALEHVPSR